MAVIFIGLLFVTVCRPFSGKQLYPTGSVSDERALHFSYTSLVYNIDSYMNNGRLLLVDMHPIAESRIQELEDAGADGAVTSFAPGVSVYYHSNIYLSDVFALGDPLLSKLPAVREDDWRIGHMYREAPQGYPETVTTGDNVIQNESLHEYYNVISLITRGPLFSQERIRAIVDINLGRYDYLIEEYSESLDENNHQITADV